MHEHEVKKEFLDAMDIFTEEVSQWNYFILVKKQTCKTWLEQYP